MFNEMDLLSTKNICFGCKLRELFVMYSFLKACTKVKNRYYIGLSTCSTLNTTLPHNLIKNKLIHLIERTFQREGSPYLACNNRNAFLLWKNLKNITHGRVKMYVMC